MFEQRLRDTLRLKMGAIYGVSVAASFASSPPLAPDAPGSVMAGHLAVHFSCRPDALAELEEVTPKTAP